jgi:hypothetical protein
MPTGTSYNDIDAAGVHLNYQDSKTYTVQISDLSNINVAAPYFVVVGWDGVDYVVSNANQLDFYVRYDDSILTWHLSTLDPVVYTYQDTLNPTRYGIFTTTNTSSTTADQVYKGGINFVDYTDSKIINPFDPGSTFPILLVVAYTLDGIQIRFSDVIRINSVDTESIKQTGFGQFSMQPKITFTDQTFTISSTSLVQVMNVESNNIKYQLIGVNADTTPANIIGAYTHTNTNIFSKGANCRGTISGNNLTINLEDTTMPTDWTYACVAYYDGSSTLSISNIVAAPALTITGLTQIGNSRSFTVKFNRKPADCFYKLGSSMGSEVSFTYNIDPVTRLTTFMIEASELVSDDTIQVNVGQGTGSTSSAPITMQA